MINSLDRSDYLITAGVIPERLQEQSNILKVNHTISREIEDFLELFSLRILL
jgi:hypothetical protein